MFVEAFLHAKVGLCERRKGFECVLERFHKRGSNMQQHNTRFQGFNNLCIEFKGWICAKCLTYEPKRPAPNIPEHYTSSTRASWHCQFYGDCHYWASSWPWGSERVGRPNTKQEWDGEFIDQDSDDHWWHKHEYHLVVAMIYLRSLGGNPNDPFLWIVRWPIDTQFLAITIGKLQTIIIYNQ